MVIKLILFIRGFLQISMWVSLKMSQITVVESEKSTKRMSGKEILAIQLMEYFKRNQGIEIQVHELVEYFKVDGKKIRRVLRELRARDRDLFYYKDGVRLVYVYKPSKELIEKIEKINELKNHKNSIKRIDTSDIDAEDVDVEVVKEEVTQ